MTRPPPLLRHGLVVAATLLLCACQPMGSDDRRAGRTPEFNRNPNPTQAYEITLALEDAPGEFKSIEGFAGYSITNATCLPPSHPITGVQTAVASTRLPISMVRTANDAYTGLVHADAFQDGNYYGHGECRWKFVGIDFDLKATGRPGETRFMASLDTDGLVGGREERRYYWAGGYPKEDIDDYPDIGSGNRGQFRPELRDEIFVIELSAKAVKP